MTSPEAADRRRVQKAAFSVGMWVAAASAIVIALGVGVLVAIILLRARVERDEHGTAFPGGHRGLGDDLVVDVDRLLPWVVGLGILGVIVLSLIAWFAARRAVRPLGEALRLQRNFVADASHELRTPLTTLTSRIQIAQRRLARGGDVAEALDQLRSDADTMNDMLTDLLMAAEGKVDSTAVCQVGEAVDAAVARLQPLADDSEVVLEVFSTDRVVRMPLPTLTRILIAVIDNAIQHSPAGAVVTIAAAAARDDVEIRVSDHGSGITPADAERIFERFARGSETGRRRGFGLGLALVRDVLTRYAGRIEVESTSPGGTTFVIALPSPRM